MQLIMAKNQSFRYYLITLKRFIMSEFLILIPARFNSSRFPGKPLAKINNKSMIQYVYENCKESGFDTFVVTDNDEIEKEVTSFNGESLRVDDDVETGSERIALAYQRHLAGKDYKYIINVQGDEPLLKSEEIKRIAKFHADNNYDIATAVKERSSDESDFRNPNVVKCIYSKMTKQCLYFSREAIPFSRESVEHDWYQHIGIYSYKVQALERFVSLKSGKYESTEKLEQLRALENRMTIGAILTDLNLIGVDSPSDIKKIEGML